MRVWLIRHGESESNAGLPTNGPGASPLTRLGRHQAERVAASFQESPELIVSSSFVRARETAAPTRERFPEVPYEEWPVQEFTYLGNLHGPATTGEQRRPFAEAYWRRADPGYINGGDGESFHDLVTRARSCLTRLADRPEQGLIAVFTHGIFMRAVLWSLFTGIVTPDTAAMRAFRTFTATCVVPNGAIVELRRGGPESLQAVAGATAHLPAPLTSSPSPTP
ncbi:histidine phosphatase family protein [Actinomadura fulvescens]|uniref:histidine phosphatase family protein n=1 Tax=Actinomadura fulvescens TaxID=46160 RepID=UPI0031D2612F